MKRLLRSRCRAARAHDAVESLNSLVAGSVCSAGASSGARAASHSWSESQRSVLHSVRDGIRAYGPRPHDMNECEALLELLRTDPLYEATPFRLAQFDASKLRVLSSDISVQDVGECAPDAITRVLRAPDASIRRSDSET